MDKIGILTIGGPVVTYVIAFDDAWSPERVLAYTASSEVHSRHPLHRPSSATPKNAASKSHHTRNAKSCGDKACAHLSALLDLLDLLDLRDLSRRTITSDQVDGPGLAVLAAALNPSVTAP